MPRLPPCAWTDIDDDRIVAQVREHDALERWQRRRPTEMLLLVIIDVHAELTRLGQIANESLRLIVATPRPNLVAHAVRDQVGAELGGSFQGWHKSQSARTSTGPLEAGGRVPLLKKSRGSTLNRTACSNKSS